MIRIYPNGEEFLKENAELLLQAPEKTAFFKGNAASMKETDKVNYILRCEDSGILLALKKSPYSLLLYGDRNGVEELASFLKENDYDISSLMCEEELGDAFVRAMEKHSLFYKVSISMTFMKCDRISEPSSADVVPAVGEDVEEIFTMAERFFIDCGLPDRPDRKSLKEKIGSFRCIREEGKIVCMACSTPMEGNMQRITHVYTRPEYRGKSLARRVVNTLKNEILENGRTACLYVDNANPVSSHLYASLGFQNMYRQNTYQLLPDGE
ncbi:MAG: GNAT family N-acetyltransferase [Erysipelotrichaceae bacterium]|nr:GNAT family N-acetyltransferase [Erysipelotrichaceae bacterium]